MVNFLPKFLAKTRAIVSDFDTVTAPAVKEFYDYTEAHVATFPNAHRRRHKAHNVLAPAHTSVSCVYSQG